MSALEISRGSEDLLQHPEARLAAHTPMIHRCDSNPIVQLLIFRSLVLTPSHSTLNAILPSKRGVITQSNGASNMLPIRGSTGRCVTCACTTQPLPASVILVISTASPSV